MKNMEIIGYQNNIGITFSAKICRSQAFCTNYFDVEISDRLGEWDRYLKKIER
jgi:hypothetical protein